MFNDEEGVVRLVIPHIMSPSYDYLHKRQPQLMQPSASSVATPDNVITTRYSGTRESSCKVRCRAIIEIMGDAVLHDRTACRDRAYKSLP